MNDFKNRVRPDWADVLRGIIKNAYDLKEKAVLAFDLDSTLFDNRPRQSRIVREFGAFKDLEALRGCQPEHWTSGWDMKAAMVACGLPSADVESLYPEAKKYWAERFFTSEYCTDDVPLLGAVEFVRAAVGTGATVAYVTGRHEGMREGTVRCMRKCGMSLPKDRVHLIMKPTLFESDDDFKRLAHAKLKEMGTLIAAFDNEPMHVNDYRLKFPNALAIHLATDHSGRPVELSEGVISVPHFQLTA